MEDKTYNIYQHMHIYLESIKSKRSYQKHHIMHINHKTKSNKHKQNIKVQLASSSRANHKTTTKQLFSPFLTSIKRRRKCGIIKVLKTSFENDLKTEKKRQDRARLGEWLQ